MPIEDVVNRYGHLVPKDPRRLSPKFPTQAEASARLVKNRARTVGRLAIFTLVVNGFTVFIPGATLFGIGGFLVGGVCLVASMFVENSAYRRERDLRLERERRG